jgi:hypothetical protein
MKNKLNMMTKLRALDEIIEDVRSQITFEDSGHLYTTIKVLEEERAKLEKEIEAAVAAETAVQYAY